MPRQRARADRLAVGDVALDQRLQQVLCARIQHFVQLGPREFARRSYITVPLAPARERARRRAPGARLACAASQASARAGRSSRSRAIALWFNRACPPAPPERFRRIALIGRHGRPGLADAARRTRRASCSRAGTRCRARRATRAASPALDGVTSIADDELARRADLAIVLGGDGTMLSDRPPARAARRAADRRQPGPAGLPDRHPARPAWSRRSARCSTATTPRSGARCSP